MIEFINGLERSKYFYLLDEVQMNFAARLAAIRLRIGLHTFFRTESMSRRTQIYVLIGLGVVLVVAFFTTLARRPRTGASRGCCRRCPLSASGHSGASPAPGSSGKTCASCKISGPHRNIFVALRSAAALAPGPAGREADLSLSSAPSLRRLLRLLQIPAEFFGYATRAPSGSRVAFFTSGDDVLVVAEGDTFLGRFRLVHIGNDTADVEELGTGRHTTVPMVQPPSDQAGAQ